MRHAHLAARRLIGGLLALMLAGPALGFEMELERVFGPADAPEEIAVLSTTDVAAIAGVLESYAARHPWQRIRYVQAASLETFRAIGSEGAPFDLVMSSAMDLQMRLVNDGLAAGVTPDATGLPAWARWRDQLFGVALEPVVTLASRRVLGDTPLPRSRRDLIAMLRDDPARFDGRVATYDPATSGVGYFLISQDAQQSEGFWRLAEVMGRLNARVFCCSGEMIRELREGRVSIAYNVVASYTARFAPDDPDLVKLSFEDYTLAIVRSAFVPVQAPNPDGGTALLSHLLSAEAQRQLAELSGAALIPGAGPAPAPNLRPIRLDAGLLVYGDQLRRTDTMNEWRGAMIQP